MLWGCTPTQTPPVLSPCLFPVSSTLQAKRKLEVACLWLHPRSDTPPDTHTPETKSHLASAPLNPMPSLLLMHAG